MQNLSSGTCFVLPNGALGGAEFIQLSLIKKIKQQQPDHTIYVIFLTSCFTENWVPILDELQISYRCISKCRSLKTALIQSIPALIQYIKEFHVEQVFSSQVFINLLLCFLKRTKLLNQKVIVRESTQVLKRVSGYKKKLVEYLYRFYSSATYIIVQTDTMRLSLLKHINGSETWNMHVLYNPIDLNEMDSKAEQNTHSYSLPQPCYVAAGRFIPEKGFDLLIQAFAFIPEPYHLVIFGEGPERNKCMNWILENELEHRIHLPGHTNNPLPYFKQAYATVLSSRLEGFPNTLLQMMSQCGCVLATHCTDEVQNLPGVLTAQPNSVEALQKILQQALLQKQTLRDENLVRQRTYLKTAHSFEPYLSLIS